MPEWVKSRPSHQKRRKIVVSEICNHHGMERVTYRDSQPAGTGQRFLRARATR